MTVGFARYNRILDVSGDISLKTQGKIYVSNVTFVDGKNVSSNPTFTDNSIDFGLKVFASKDQTEYYANFEVTVINDTFYDQTFSTNYWQTQFTDKNGKPVDTLSAEYELIGIKNGDVIKMDGTSKPIFVHNKDASLVLNEETVVPYATFVLDAVQTDQGTLRLVEHVDEDTFTDTPTPQQRKEVTHLTRPAKVTKTDDGFKLDVIMLYGDSVFRADLDVKNDGYIEIVGEEKLAEGMPVRPIFLE